MDALIALALMFSPAAPPSDVTQPPRVKIVYGEDVSPADRRRVVRLDRSFFTAPDAGGVGREPTLILVRDRRGVFVRRAYAQRPPSAAREAARRNLPR